MPTLSSKFLPDAFPPLYSRTFRVNGCPKGQETRYLDAHCIALEAIHGNGPDGTTGYRIREIVYHCPGPGQAVANVDHATQKTRAMTREETIDYIKEWEAKHAGCPVLENPGLSKPYLNYSTRGGRQTRPPVKIVPQLANT